MNWWVNYIEHFLILASTITGCISISAFASLLGIPVGYTSSAIGLTICAIAAGIKKYKSILKKKENKQDKIILLEKSKSNRTEVLIFKTLVNSVISHEELVWINNLLKYYERNERRNEKYKELISLSKILVYL